MSTEPQSPMTPEPEVIQRTALPTGTVTFLFTDIEGSTQRWEQHRDAMKAAVARQERLLGDAISANGGYVFKTVGDAFCAAFATAPDALLAAVDAQRALANEDFSAVGGLRVRMGLHTGFAEERNADYFGPAVNRVARLMSLGHGGQILLSGVTRDLSHNDLPKGAMLSDLGSHRLKDLAEAEQVWQLTIDRLPSEFPPLKSLDTIANNLTVQRTTFVGRERDVAEVKELLGRYRLLTLFGAGGVGKTRLALQVGADVLDHYPDGVWLADFAPITDPELVSSVIAKVLGMGQVEDRRVDESIPIWLKRKKLLLILDNCEHVLEAVASIADTILDKATDVRVVTTSRQALGVSGEQVLRLPSLDVPHKLGDLTPTSVIEFGAVALFVDRARLIDRSFTLTDDTAPIVAEICRRLDGIPLAIELAAARVKVLSIPHLAQRLNERFKILTGGSRSALPRQKTLGALIDWSYDLLSTHEQLLFTRLASFAGGFSLDAATAVCGSEGLEESEVFDLLSSLTDKSLVVAETSREQERYRMLESTRAYALDKLVAAGEHERLARRHAEYFRDKAIEADKSYGVGSTLAWLADAELELDNYRAALEWAFTDGHDVVGGGALAGALERLWREGGLTVEGRYWIGRAQADLDESAQPQVAARLWRALAVLSTGKRKHECAERAFVLFQSVGDNRSAGWARVELGYGLYQMGRLEEALEANTGALAALRESGDRPGVARCLMRQAGLRWLRGDVIGGHDLYAQALEAYKGLKDEAGAAVVLGNLAEVEFAEGHVEEALRLSAESLEINIRGKNAERLSIDYLNTATYRIASGELDRARDAARKGLRWGRQSQSAIETAIAVQHLALVAALSGQVHGAARLIGYVDERYKELGQEREISEAWGYDKLMSALREQLSEPEIEKLSAEGAAWSEDQAVEEALKA